MAPTGGARAAAPVVDADGHATEDWDAFMELLPEEIRPLAPWFGEREDGRFGLLSIEGRRWDPAFDLEPTPALEARQARMGAGMGSEIAPRLAALDSEGIDHAVLYPSLGLFFGLYRDAEVAAAVCRAQNTWMGRWCGQAERRLSPVAVLPQQDPDLAAAELQLAVEQDGAVAGMVRPNPVAGRRVDEPDFDVLWRTAVDLDVPVVLHEGWMGGGYDTVGLERARSYAAAHAMSHPFEQMAALLSVVASGVLVRFPGLRLGFFEAGCGWAPWWAERIDDHVDLFPRDFPSGGALLSRRVWLTFEPGEPGVEAVADAGWADNLCFASDYPHLDSSFPGTVRTVRDLKLRPELEERLLGGNAMAFYGERLRRRLAGGPSSPTGAASTSTATSTGTPEPTTGAVRPGPGPDDPKLAFLRSRRADEVDHSEGDLLAHLEGTRDLLIAWGADAVLADAGLFHSVYGTESFDGGLGLDTDGRSQVASVIGPDAEALAWLFGRATTASVIAAGASGGALVDRETGAVLDADEATLDRLCELTVANWFEQRPRLPLAHQDAFLAEAGRLRARLSPAARGTIALAETVEPDDRAFRRWVGNSFRAIHVDLGGGPPPVPRFDPALMLGDPDAVLAMQTIADHLVHSDWDHERGDDPAGHLALGHPVPAAAVIDLIDEDGLEALDRSTAVDRRDDEVQLGCGLMRLGDDVVVVPREGSRTDPVYLGFEALLLSPLLAALDVRPALAVDLGTGSGLVATLDARRSGYTVATDIDGRAAATAGLSLSLRRRPGGQPGQGSSRRTGGSATSVLRADVSAGLRAGSADLVTANPPLVPTRAHRQPVFADGGPTGTELPLRFLDEGVRLLRPGGVFAMLTLDSTLVDGRRPLRTAVAGLGPDLQVTVLATPHHHLRPSYVPKLLAEHADRLAATEHVAVVVERPPTGHAATPAPWWTPLLGLGWAPRSSIG